MLGRLARWLRLLGYDTLYFPDIKDSDLLRTSIREDRILLTRDTHFLKIKNVRNLLIVHSNDPMQQVIEVTRSLGIREVRPGRCARCNGILVPVDRKEGVRDLVPEYIFFHCSNFQRCRDCGSIYWEGTHLKRFRTMLDSVLKESGRQAPL